MISDQCSAPLWKLVWWVLTWVLTWPRYVNDDRCSTAPHSSSSDNDSHLTSHRAQGCPRVSNIFSLFSLQQQYLITWGVEAQILTGLRTEDTSQAHLAGTGTMSLRVGEETNIIIIKTTLLLYLVNWRNVKFQHKEEQRRNKRKGN